MGLIRKAATCTSMYAHRQREAKERQEAIGLAATSAACCCLPERALPPAALALTGWGCSDD